MTESTATPQKYPRHVAIVMDGNGRWARQHGLPRIAGHKAGMDTVRTIIKSCLAHNISVLTLFAFSSENWRRPREEVSWLMELFMTALEREVAKLHERGVRLMVIGDRSAFAAALQERIEKSENLTRDNQRMTLVIAANYGGRWDIATAARKLAQRVASGELAPDEITMENISATISLAELPEPDLFIRTGGEQRISNFLLWQLAYTELYFSPLLWPDFDEQAFTAALADFGQRQRRFGHTGEQIEQMYNA
ncbi:MAG TPA: polyprenyl diphosphate synthase [Gammaproteobacteria bacterium]